MKNRNVEQVFRTYTSLNASVFDLISGNNEVKQTTGLSYLFSKDKTVLNDFLNLPEIKKMIGKINVSDYDKVIVHSESKTVNRKRADIVIQLIKKDIPNIALIIEAKNANKNTSVKSLVNQLNGYLKSEQFIGLDDYKTFGCSLTKNELVITEPNMASISWSKIFKLLKGKKGLAKDYLEFVTKIKGTMKFYEKEVYSIPAGRTHEYIYNYPYIYDCPNSGPNYTSLKKPLYMAFRKKLGIMERVFGVEEIIIMNPKTDFKSFLDNESYSDDIKKRVTKYRNSRWEKGDFVDEERQIFILSLTNQIELKHKPRPPKNNSFRAYYKLAELLNEDNQIVEKESNQS